jgi:integrase
MGAVNRDAGIITRIGKGDRKVVTPITEDVAAILDSCEGHRPENVFTYVRRQPGEGRGQRFPITPAGAKTHWRRLRARSGVKNFRFHDIRHDVATKLLRQTGNLKIVQKATSPG